jgi:peptide chain release factor subunit 3
VECGENVRVKLKGVEENDISAGFVLCDPNNPIKSCKMFDAQVRAVQLLNFVKNAI